MKFQIEINCDNAAFWGCDPKVEVSRILELKTREWDWNCPNQFPDSGKLRDINGNVVGFWKFTD